MVRRREARTRMFTHAVQRPHAPFGAGRPGFRVPRDTRDPVDHSKPHLLLTQDP